MTSAATPLDIERLVAKHGYSRYPVVDDLGDLGGYLHLKDVLYADEVERLEPCRPSGCAGWPTSGATTRSSRCCRPCSSPGSHLARVVAEDGTVVGVVFLEDVIEELVGEVSDSSQR